MSEIERLIQARLHLELKTITSGLYYKSFTIVIYDRIDSGQYYKTMIMIISYPPHLTLALSSVINYDR